MKRGLSEGGCAPLLQRWRRERGSPRDGRGGRVGGPVEDDERPDRFPRQIGLGIQEFKIKMAELQALKPRNDLTPPQEVFAGSMNSNTSYYLRRGQRIKLPRLPRHTAAPGY